MEDYDIDDDKFNILENSLCSNVENKIQGDYNITDDGLALVTVYKGLLSKLKRELYYTDIYTSKDDPESIRPLNEYIADLKSIRQLIKRRLDRNDDNSVHNVLNGFFNEFDAYSKYDKDAIRLMLIDYTDVALHCYPFVRSL